MSPQKPETGYLDRLGGRFLVRGRSGDYVEILIFRDELVAVAGFEAAVRGEVARLADFRHPSIRRIRGVARLAEPDNRLALVSDSSPGRRLSDVLLETERESRPISGRATLFIIREVLAAVNALYETSGGVCHGAIGPERIVVAPDGRVLVVEHVLASALDCHTTETQERFWRDYRVAVIDEEETPRFGPRTDVLQVGLVAMALVLGRLLRRDEFPRQIGELLLGATEIGPLGSRTPIGLGLRAWLARSLQFGSQDSYATVGQALAGLEQILGVNGYVADPSAVLAMLAPAPGPAPVEAAPVPGTDSGPHAVAAPAEQVRAADQQAAPRSVTPVAREDTAAVAAMGVRAENIHSAATPLAVAPATARASEAASGESAASGPAPVPVSVESLSTPRGVECIAADVRPQSAATPKSGSHRTASWLQVHPASGTPRQPAADIRSPQAPPAPVPAMLGADEAGEAEPQPDTHRRWMMIGAAAAGLLLVAGVPGLWLLTRPSTPAPVSAAVEAPPAASPISMDAVPTGPPAPAAPKNDSRAGGPGAAVPGTAPVTPPRGDEAGAAPAAGPPADNGRAAQPLPAVAVGRISVTASLPMQIIEKGYQLGASPGNAISLPAGRHDLELVNDSIGYRETRAVDVAAGRTVAVVVTLPKGTVSFNAIPWAEVWADGQKVGETPLGNIEMAAGPHEVSFRHPQLGERRLTIVVPVNGPQRVSMDMRKQ